MADRVLIEIVTAANMAGVKQAQAGFLGMNKSTLALAAALGGLVMIGKSAIENTEALQRAHLSLAQAEQGRTRVLRLGQAAFDTWAESNKRYVADQYDAETALAGFVRQGLHAKESMRALNDALDWAVIKGISMTEAQQAITLALSGSTRGLKQFGITTAQLTAITKSHLTVAEKHAAILKLIERHTKDGRKATTELGQSQNSLNKDWQDLTTKIGPPLLSLFSGVVGWVDKLVKGLDDLGHNKGWNKGVSDFLGVIQNSIIEDVRWVQSAIEDMRRFANYVKGSADTGQVGSVTPSNFTHKASGGSVIAGGAYLVGERGPEMLLMGNRGGQIIPNGAGGGGNHIHIHVDRGAFIDGPSIDRLANLILQRARYAPGR